MRSCREIGTWGPTVGGDKGALSDGWVFSGRREVTLLVSRHCDATRAREADSTVNREFLNSQSTPPTRLAPTWWAPAPT